MVVYQLLISSFIEALLWTGLAPFVHQVTKHETISHLPLNVILLNVLFLESELQGNWKIFKPAQIVQMAGRLVQHSLVNDVKILLPLLLILSKIWQI